MLNYSHDSGDANESTVRLLTDVSERLYARLSQLGLDGEAGRDLLRELAVAPEWSSRDYHVRHKSEHGGAGGEMEVRLSAMSDYVRAMLYSAPLEPDGGAPSPATGDHGEEARDEGDFATDPRNAHHDGRNRRPRGDSFVTALLYLNSEGEAFEGGEPLEGGHTLFLDDDAQPVARKGSLLLFDQHVYRRRACAGRLQILLALGLAVRAVRRADGRVDMR